MQRRAARPASRPLLRRLPPVGMPPAALVLTAVVSVQIGSGLATRVFGQVSSAGMTGVRLWSAALLLAVFGGRGLIRALRATVAARAWGDGAVIVAFGFSLAVMNFSIYQSFARIPLGIAVTIEFLGPLGVAVVSSRRVIDLLWVGLAATGVLLLAAGGSQLARPPAAGQHGPASVAAGVIFALVAGAAWAAYILLSRSTGRRFGGSAGLTIAMLVAAALVTPAAVTAGRALLRPQVLATGVAVGVLSSVIPYRLELDALRRIPARVFGILMSLEPAVAALAGLVMLGEALSAAEWAAIGSVVVASAGAARSGAAGGSPEKRVAATHVRGRPSWPRSSAVPLAPTIVSVPANIVPANAVPAGAVPVSTVPAAPGVADVHAGPDALIAPDAARVPARVGLPAAVSAAAPAGAAGPAAGLPRPPGRTAAARRRLPGWAGVLIAPSVRAMRGFALAGIAAAAAIILTGAAVRLSQSGLGCPDWPACTARSVVASGTTGSSLLHRWIEFGNRLVTIAIFLAAAAVCTAAVRFRDADGRRRRDLIWLGAAQPAAIVVQAVLGGVVVLTGLNPVWVSIHFIASMTLVAAAVMLYVRSGEGTGRPRVLVRPEVRLLAAGVVAVVALMLAAGTVVTGTGPLAGARSVARYHLPLTGVSQLHADIGWLLAGLVIALALSLRLSDAPRRARRLGAALLALVLAQGSVGYSQYFSGLPAGLVWVHVTGSVLIWITALLLLFALRDRAATPAEPASATVTQAAARLPR